MKAILKGIKWGLIALSVFVAFISITLRVVLPRIDTAQIPLQNILRQISDFDVEFSTIKGNLRFLIPSLQVENIKLKTENYGEVISVKTVDLHIDLLASLFNGELNFSHFTIDGLHLDLTKVSNQKETESITLSERLERLFLVDLKNFSITNSTLTVLTPKNEIEVVDIEFFKGSNDLNHHRMQGLFNVRNVSNSQIEINADFKERGGLSTLDGIFYINTKNISLSNWLAPYLKNEKISSQTQLSANALIKVKKGSLDSLKVQFAPSSLSLFDNSLAANIKEHKIYLEKGKLSLWKNENSQWLLRTDDISIGNDENLWSNLFLTLQSSGQDWLLNIEEFDLFWLHSFVQFIELPEQIKSMLAGLQPKGKIKDLYLAKNKDTPIAYSGKIQNLSSNAWRYLPKTQNVFLSFAGKGSTGKASLNLIDTTLPYQTYFQAPLAIEKANIDLFWAYEDKDLHFWSTKSQVNTANLFFNGNFLLSIAENESPWLSLYAEASLTNAGNTWRYLPMRALRPNLTNYLSQSIQAGVVNNAKILWNGALDAFPYQKKQGVFQAWVPLKRAEFRFNTQWPALTDLDLDLLFENDAMFLNSNNVKTFGARGYDLSGHMTFDNNEPLKINTKLDASGDQLRNYMLATPLVDSVGAALNHIKVDGKIKGNLALTIPFDGTQVDVEGSVKLFNNQVAITTPKMKLENAKGSIFFKNDKVWSKNINANLLDQAVKLNFQGSNLANDYVVNVKMHGDWQTEILKNKLNNAKSIPFTGKSAWSLGVDLALKDVGFNYNVILNADLSNVKSSLPAPFDTKSLLAGKLDLKASGNQLDVEGQLKLPNFKYQASIDITKEAPLIKRSRTVIGKGELPLTPLLENSVSINLPKLNLMDWAKVYETFNKEFDTSSPESIRFMPISKLNARIDKMFAIDMNFHDFSLGIERKKEDLHIIVNSQELDGDALWQMKKQQLNLNIEEFFINAVPSQLKNKHSVRKDRSVATLADRDLIKNIPSIDMTIKNLWIQGYRFGQLNTRLKKSQNRLALTQFTLQDNNNKIDLNGQWYIDRKGLNNTAANFSFSGKNSTELMDRFGFENGVQDARFMTKGNINFKSVPWALNVKTLNGKSETSLEKGYISGVGGASRILGLFSIDSIIRKLKLDFSGVFDDGLAFDTITGSVDIRRGIATTDNIEMKALAGDMYIKGSANLDKNTVNANVRFVPDLTSGIPILTAFAVAPQTAIYVLAVTTVLSPVIEAFTQIQYQVTGNIDKPIVKEVSRRRSEIEVSEEITENLRE